MSGLTMGNVIKSKDNSPIVKSNISPETRNHCAINYLVFHTTCVIFKPETKNNSALNYLVFHIACVILLDVVL
jgi:hypothetical protein